jgi:hypothetical protein
MLSPTFNRQVHWLESMCHRTKKNSARASIPSQFIRPQGVKSTLSLICRANFLYSKKEYPSKEPLKAGGKFLPAWPGVRYRDYSNRLARPPEISLR